MRSMVEGGAAWNLGLGHRPLHHPSGGPPPHGYAAGRIKNVPFRPKTVVGQPYSQTA